MTSPRGLTGHAHDPLPGSAYSAGPSNAGLPADLRNPGHYPVTANCRCGSVIRCERLEQHGWASTGRAAGDTL